MEEGVTQSNCLMVDKHPSKMMGVLFSLLDCFFGRRDLSSR